MFYQVQPGPRPFGSWKQGGIEKDLGRMVVIPGVDSAVLSISHNGKCALLGVVIMPPFYLLTSQG